MSELTREENLKRSKLGMREDRSDGIWAQHKHAFGLNSISFQDLPIIKEPVTQHDCIANRCGIGTHKITMSDIMAAK